MDDQDFDPDILLKSEVILVSPWVKQSHDVYKNYSKKIKSELQFLSELLPIIGLKNPIRIGITATNWKSTTTWIAYNVLKKMFPNKNVWITWNFDIPVSEILAQIIEQDKKSEEHIFVVECSSFMLYGLRDFVFDYSILLNIARDHLDWHKDFDEYQESKLALLRCTSKAFFVPESSWFLLDDSLLNRGIKIEESFDLSKTKFLGKHNQINISTIQALIIRYCQDSGLDLEYFKSAFMDSISKVDPLPHRLWLLREVDWIRIYDDWICTSSHSLAAALSSFQEKIVLIAWWYDKWDNYSRLSELFISKVWYAVLIWQTSKEFAILCETANVPYILVSSLQWAVNIAFEQAKKLKLYQIVFSPGSASFDMFKNVYDRVEQFEKIVKNL